MAPRPAPCLRGLYYTFWVLADITAAAAAAVLAKLIPRRLLAIDRISPISDRPPNKAQAHHLHWQQPLHVGTLRFERNAEAAREFPCVSNLL